MSILTIIFVLIAVGVLMYLVNRFIPMEPTIRNIINIVVVVAIVLWLLKLSGVLTALGSVRI